MIISHLHSRLSVKYSPDDAAPPPNSGLSKRGSKKVLDNKRGWSISPPDLSHVDIDPDEQTYCLCDQVSYGEMIGCHNDLCPIEWFHFTCIPMLLFVSLNNQLNKLK